MRLYSLERLSLWWTASADLPCRSTTVKICIRLRWGEKNVACFFFNFIFVDRRIAEISHKSHWSGCQENICSVRQIFATTRASDCVKNRFVTLRLLPVRLHFSCWRESVELDAVVATSSTGEELRWREREREREEHACVDCNSLVKAAAAQLVDLHASDRQDANKKVW